MTYFYLTDDDPLVRPGLTWTSRCHILASPFESSVNARVQSEEMSQDRTEDLCACGVDDGKGRLCLSKAGGDCNGASHDQCEV